MSSDLCPQCVSVLKVVGGNYDDGDDDDDHHIDDDVSNRTDHSNVYNDLLRKTFSVDKILAKNIIYLYIGIRRLTLRHMLHFFDAFTHLTN